MFSRSFWCLRCSPSTLFLTAVVTVVSLFIGLTVSIGVFDKSGACISFIRTCYYLPAVVSTVLVIVFSSLAAYSFSKLQFKGKNALYMVFICSLMLPKEIFIVPLFKIVQALEWSDTYMGMIVPTVASVPMLVVFLLFQRYFTAGITVGAEKG